MANIDLHDQDKGHDSIGGVQWLVLGVAILMFGVWLALNGSRMAADQNGIIRLVLSLFFALLIVARPKSLRGTTATAFPAWAHAALALAGTIGIASGLVLRIHQIEWLGVLLLFWTAITWSLPANYRRDISLALLIVYWIHPVPGQMFNPLEFEMQRLSVLGAERVLHTLVEPAWADGMVIRTGLRVFEVPAACSGMKTAVTVLLCVLALGILRRMRIWETAVLVVLGLSQVLLLNIVRITVLVKIGASQPPDWSPRILHDTVAVFLLVAVALLHLEAALWMRWRQAHRRLRRLEDADDFVGEKEEKIRIFPRFWQFVFRWWWAGVIVAILIASSTTFIYRNMPHHRAMMINAVVRGLLVVDPDSAERAIAAGLAVEPGHYDLLLARIRVHFMRRQYQKAIDEIRNRKPGEIDIELRAMEARSLFLLARLPEAEAALDKLPPDTRAWPGIAMLFAEIAAVQDKPAVVAKNLKIAAQWSALADRVHALYPYLAARQQWQAVIDSATDRPYRQPLQAVIAINAALRMNNIGAAIRAMRRGLQQWPRDPIFMDSLLALSILRPGTEWEDRFAEVFDANLATRNADDLARFIEICFLAVRPDLAWQAYRRLERLDAHDPALFLAPAQFAPQWFTFRRRFLGMAAETAELTIDLRDFARLTRRVIPWQALWDRVPLGNELLGEKTADLQVNYQRLALEDLQRREAAGSLTLRMKRSYPRVLAMQGRLAEAHTRLDRLENEHPEMREEVLLERSDFYAREQRWAEVYETTRAYRQKRNQPNQQGSLQMVEALVRLNLGAYAMVTLEELRRLFPESSAVRTTLAETWNYYGFPEEALFVQNQDRAQSRSIGTANLLYRSGRIIPARRIAAALGDGTLNFPNRIQPFLPVPAELAVTWNGQPFSSEVYAREAEQLTSEGTSDSPFIRHLRDLNIAWLRMRGEGNASDPERWIRVGRDAQEQAMALHTLALLLGRQGRTADAQAAAVRATKLLPEAAILWRLVIATSGGDRPLVNEAQRQAPADPEIWLAYIVSRHRAEGSGPWVSALIDSAATAHQQSPGTLVRAGDYCLRFGMLSAAETAARHAIRDGQGLLSAYVLGIRCALSQTNRPWALACAMGAIDHAIEPWPFYQMVVDLKVQEQRTDADLVRALDMLSARFPDETRYVKRLGDIYFARGETGNALSVLDQALSKRGSRGLGVHAILLAAESARIEGKIEKGIEILQAARADFPDDINLLNNLVYYLAQDQRTLPQAVRLLPGLLTDKAGFDIMDTVAMVYLRNGDTDRAAVYMRKSLELINKGNYAWHEMYLNAAEVYLAQGDHDNARKLIEEVRKDSRRTPSIENRARELYRNLK